MLAERCRDYKIKSIDERRGFLDGLRSQSINQFEWFGGWNFTRVLEDAKLIPVKQLTSTAYSDRRRKFKAMTEQTRQALLAKLEDKGEEPETYFGGWSLERVLTTQPKGKSTGKLANAGYAYHRKTFKAMTEQMRQALLAKLESKGEEPEIYFGEWSLEQVLIRLPKAKFTGKLIM